MQPESTQYISGTAAGMDAGIRSQLAAGNRAGSARYGAVSCGAGPNRRRSWPISRIRSLELQKHRGELVGSLDAQLLVDIHPSEHHLDGRWCVADSMKPLACRADIATTSPLALTSRLEKWLGRTGH